MLLVIDLTVQNERNVFCTTWNTVCQCIRVLISEIEMECINTGTNPWVLCKPKLRLHKVYKNNCLELKKWLSWIIENWRLPDDRLCIGPWIFLMPVCIGIKKIFLPPCMKFTLSSWVFRDTLETLYIYKKCLELMTIKFLVASASKRFHLFCYDLEALVEMEACHNFLPYLNDLNLFTSITHMYF